MDEHKALKKPTETHPRGVTCSLTEATLESQAREAGEDRRARRLSQLMERESSTLTGVLVEAAERRTPVTIDIHGNIKVSGYVTAVGSDATIISDISNGEQSLVRNSVVLAVRTHSTATITGDRTGDLPDSFQALLEELGALNEFVNVTCIDGSTFAGQLNWIGQDVAQLQVGARGAASHAYLNTNSIAIVTTR